MSPMGIGTKLLGFYNSWNLPKLIPNCVLWVRADLGISLSSGSVSHWSDQSGNNDSNRSFQTGAGPTTYTASDQLYNNQSTISFGGSATMSSVGGWSITLTQPYTLFLVGNDSGSGSTQIYFENTNANIWFVYTNGVAGKYCASGPSNFISGGTVSAIPHIYEVEMNDPSTTLRISAETPVQIGNTSKTADIVFGLVIGGTTGGGSLIGKIAEIVVYNGLLTPSNRTMLFNYFSARYNIPIGS